MGMVFIATQARTTWGITMADDDSVGLPFLRRSF